MKNINSFNSEQILEVNKQIYKYFDLKTVSDQLNVNLFNVPISIKIILENLLRNEDGDIINKKMISSAFTSPNSFRISTASSVPKFSIISATFLGGFSLHFLCFFLVFLSFS